MPTGGPHVACRLEEMYNIALSNLRCPHDALSILGNFHVPCHYLKKNPLLHVTIIKWGFHRPANHAHERHKKANEWNFEKIFGRGNGFVKSDDQYY